MSKSMGENIIFLVSQPRSGSTMLQNLLAQHPLIHTVPEPWILLHPIYALREDGFTAEYDHNLSREALLEFTSSLEGGLANFDAAVREYALYFYRIACQQSGKQIFLDKTPRYYHILPELLRIFPSAKFILLFRNPLAVLNSILTTHVKGYWLLLARYRHDLLTAPECLVSVVEQMNVPVYALRYEDLVQETQQSLQELSNYLELNFDKNMLNYDPEIARAGMMGDATGVQNYNQPSAEKLHHWVEIGRNAQSRYFALEYLQALGSELISKMGYDLQELKNSIESTTVVSGQVELTWDALFAPNEVMQKRLALIELALIQHSRIVNFFKSWRKRRK